jgi:tetratricopeptide (TPR) repeat protein
LKEVARNLVKQRKNEEGIALLEKAVKLDSSDIDALADISNLLLNETQESQAIVYIKKGMELDSNSIKMRQLRARYAYRNFDYEQVRKDLKYTLSKGDSSVLYQRLLATSYFYLDSLAQSIFLFNR